MRNMLSFVCPELDTTYQDAYRELAQHLEMSIDETMERFAPDDAVAGLRYHRRQARRRAVFQELATELGVDATTVFAACSADGAQILLDAIREKQSSVALSAC
ncbi:MAG: hypothetical protein VKP62_07295 [Candidatus Sericytochromatia bacterium]|nr:hypothetical protein [Candidatus Sericytochromatia bacterium]